MVRLMLIAGALAFGATGIVQTPLYAANIEIEAEGPVIELKIYENVESEPDMVSLGAGVVSEGKTAQEALRQNSAQMKRVIDRIKALGVPASDIRTTRVSVSPRYDYNSGTTPRPVIGYRASNRVNLKLRDISKAGATLDALVSVGATNVFGPRFELQDDSAVKAKARANALQRASAQAKNYAAILGYDGHKVLEIKEVLSGNSRTPRRVRTGAVRGTGETPIEPGLVSTGITLTISFELTKDDTEGAEKD